MIRGFFLIPGTPFVFAGILLFPDNPVLVLSIAMASIVFSATLLYYFSDWLGYGDYLLEKHKDKVGIWLERLKSPKATWIVIAWAFFPPVPTELICYLAAIVKMPYRNMIAGIFIGELVLFSIYIYFGKGIYELLM